MLDSPLMWAAALASALLVGFAKTGVPNLGILIVPLMVVVWGERTAESVGALLVLLIVGDIFAMTWYKRHAKWENVRLPLLCAVPGILVARLFLGHLEGHAAAFKLSLGILVLGLLGLDLLRTKVKLEKLPRAWWFTVLMCSLAGFATTIGNAAGPIMMIYFLSLGLKKEEFMGTQAWFFFIVNLVKVPIFLHAGMINADTFAFDLRVGLAVVVGAVIGIKVLPKIPQQGFVQVVKVLTAVAAGGLIWSALGG